MKKCFLFFPFVLVFSLFMSIIVFVGCDSDDGPALSSLLPGKWYVEDYSLVVDGDSSYYLSIEQIGFGTDGRFQIFDLHDGLVDSGCYEAGNDYIRFDYERADEEYTLLWSVHSFSEKEVRASYHSQDSKRNVQARITLGKERPTWLDE